MGFTEATPLKQTTYQAMYFDGTPQSAAQTLTMIDSLLTARKLHYGIVHGSQEVENPTQWRVQLMRRDGSAELIAIADRWIVVSSTGQVRVLTPADYRAEFAVE
ncbi:hypothetical protein [Mycobacteroides abscessus]|uniref:hypothetical protein n=1 Tax=Mycobacteroides abscessus TaxID=36809 RepID=UPI00092825CA|nr:hypothetical protein [Mycobacteroides abscessus]SIB68953.1 Uncharacterised protein [Mycobacteroides abscessus subsp. abscessus]